jgi:hypothetical protein
MVGPGRRRFGISRSPHGFLSTEAPWVRKFGFLSRGIRWRHLDQDQREESSGIIRALVAVTGRQREKVLGGRLRKRTPWYGSVGPTRSGPTRRE